MTETKIISFNINGIRARLHQLQALIDKHQPDIIGLQEIKVHDDQFPLAAVEAMGYHVNFFGQKAHYGVAILSKTAPTQIIKGWPWDEEDAQKRMIIGTWQLASGKTLHVFNGYFPQGENRDHPTKFPAKHQFYADLQRYLDTHHKPDDAVAIIGDMNISPTDLDIGIGEQNAKRWLKTGKCSFLPEEREWLGTLKNWGLKDCFRELYPTEDSQFSWFDYRSKGFDDNRGLRIDLVLASPPLAAQLQSAGIDYELRTMEKPSDHAPIWASFSL